ncbi:MAG: nuclear transport factor 2 family protein [Leptolyngbyaceae cyanobacterium]
MTAVEALVQQARQAWLEGDAHSFAILFVEDGEFIAPGHRWVGHSQIFQAVMDYAAAYDEVSIEIHRIIQDRERFVVEWSWRDREKATGKCTYAEDAIVVDLKQGKIQRWREYIDVVESN